MHTDMHVNGLRPGWYELRPYGTPTDIAKNLWAATNPNTGKLGCTRLARGTPGNGNFRFLDSEPSLKMNSHPSPA